VGDLAKGHAPRAALALGALEVCGFGDVHRCSARSQGGAADDIASL
jgi:hypothetical protein